MEKIQGTYTQNKLNDKLNHFHKLFFVIIVFSIS